ncbi:RB1-inducible coiled-coil protein 1 isoform X2 [Coccinella septempunctata]|uniref:RB1-inducible coiled-coil protein 1 isoform X2 n=1 Tax=Coccinella septempunctata TaxID=41139 RepID=UPI001D079B7D|nr:RB1-inducible coiled-coil protein 1 isoform X2 [Coccinella septempunctata]
MLYLFDITKFPSNWMHLDMGLTAASVQTLKEHIQAKYKINADDQVLLVSGGVCLDASKIVCHYSAGTDSNPIYFFNKKIDKTVSFPECPDVTTTTDELSSLYKKLAKVIPSFQAVIDRAHLAERMATSARLIIEHCEEIIRDHHVANQGWLAAVANYDDVVNNCLTHYKETKQKFGDYVKVRDYFQNFLEKFKEKLPLFKKIPILQKLLRPHDGENRLMLESETSEGLCEDESEDTYTSFFDWIGKDEQGNSIDTIFKNCEEEIEFYKDDTFESSFNAVPQTLALAGSSNKEINVSFWLSHLDELINKAKAIVEEQTKISSSIQLNVARMKDCKDMSILPHLCETHEQELEVMNENHSILKDIENTCIKAKYEFTLNVQSRIGWIVHIENELQHIGVQLDIFNESLERLKYQMDILEKIYAAPTAYFACIAETVRRRSFSQAFLMWASEMACRLHTMHNEEVTRRKEFLTKYEDTFVQMLFPGLDDLPPSYGTKAPSYFDTSLPKLTVEDIDFLKKSLPDLPKELTECLSLEESSDLSYYLSFKSILNTQSDKLEEELQLDNLVDKAEDQNENVEKVIVKEGVAEASLTAIHGLPHLRDVDRGCESETDTEEFEKVGQSPLELNFNKEARPKKPNTQDVSTSIEETLEMCKSEYSGLRSSVSQICTVASQSINQIKSELDEFKRSYTLSKSQLLELLKTIVIGYEKLCDEQKSHEQSVVLKLTTEHKNEISDFRRLAQVKNEEIKSLRTNLLFLENKLKKVSEDATTEKNNADLYKRRCEELAETVSFMEKVKENTIKAITEKLNREHADKIKTLQSRFRLMTMERTMSDSSLEKTLELSIPSNQQSVYSQMQENFEFQKEACIRETQLLEAKKWEKAIIELKSEFESEKESLVKSMNEIREEEMKKLQEREKQLLDEVNQYTETIRELTSALDASSKINNEGSNEGEQARAPIVENTSFSVLELQKEKTETVAMAGSYSEGKVDCATSPIKQRKSISKTLNVLGKSSRPNVDVMKPGDCLVIVWDDEYQNFRIVQNGPIIYFLHLDCLHSLGLEILGGSQKRPNKLYCLGEYVEKEYCYARKSENRFNVPQGTRFFRVTVRPLQQEKINQQPSNLQSSEGSSSSQQAGSMSIAELELAPIPPLPRWRYSPNRLPPETFGIVRDNKPEVSEPSDNNPEDSISLPFQTASSDINDQQHDPVSTGDDLSESL